MKKSINLHSSKIWDFIYPLYANLIVFGNDYESLANVIEKDFNLTCEQWGAILSQWEYIHGIVITSN